MQGQDRQGLKGKFRRRVAACAVFLAIAVAGGAVSAVPATAAAVPVTVNPLPSVDPISDPTNYSVLVNKSRPLNPASYAPSDLVNARGSGQYMRAEAAAWLNGLFQGAADAGTGGLSIVSGYRSYAQQQQVYAASNPEQTWWQQTLPAVCCDTRRRRRAAT
ncbi:D-alanyl-D-alanine carboxypeptidase family protein [Paenarthrobacter sp. RAF9]